MSEAKLDLILEKLDRVTHTVDVLQQDVAGLKQDVAGLKQDVAAIHKRLDRHEDMIVQIIGIAKSTNEKVAALAERQDVLERKQLKLEHGTEVLNRDLFWMKADIELLKSR